MLTHTRLASVLGFALALASTALAQPAAAPAQPPHKDQAPAPTKPAESPTKAPAPKAPNAPTKDAAPTPAAATPAPRSDKWWQDKHAAIVERVKQGGHQTVFLGDSITEGWGGAGKKIWAERFADAHPVNCGIGGDQTQHVLARLDDGLLDALAAKNNCISTVVLLIGTNNLSNPKEQPEDIAAGVHAIVERLHAKLPDAKLVLMAIFPRGEKANAQRETITKANTLIKAQNTGAKISVVDLGPKFINDQGEIPKDLMPDFLHLSEAGYRVWAEGIKDKIAKPKSAE